MGESGNDIRESFFRGYEVVDGGVGVSGVARVARVKRVEDGSEVGRHVDEGHWGSGGFPIVCEGLYMF